MRLIRANASRNVGNNVAFSVPVLLCLGSLWDDVEDFVFLIVPKFAGR